MNSITEYVIREGQVSDLPELKKLFLDTITKICNSDYDEEQINAWIFDTKYNRNQQRWIDILEKQFVLVAQNENEIVGFITLESGNYIDLLYVHKNYQRQGIANSLYDHIEKAAKQQNQSLLTSNVSKTARAFFEKVGFVVTKKQTVVRQNVELINFTMTKII